MTCAQRVRACCSAALVPPEQSTPQGTLCSLPRVAVIASQLKTDPSRQQNTANSTLTCPPETDPAQQPAAAPAHLSPHPMLTVLHDLAEGAHTEEPLDAPSVACAPAAPETPLPLRSSPAQACELGAWQGGWRGELGEAALSACSAASHTMLAPPEDRHGTYCGGCRQGRGVIMATAHEGLARIKQQKCRRGGGRAGWDMCEGGGVLVTCMRGGWQPSSGVRRGGRSACSLAAASVACAGWDGVARPGARQHPRACLWRAHEAQAHGAGKLSSQLLSQL